MIKWSNVSNECFPFYEPKDFSLTFGTQSNSSLMSYINDIMTYTKPHDYT